MFVVLLTILLALQATPVLSAENDSTEVATPSLGPPDHSGAIDSSTPKLDWETGDPNPPFFLNYGIVMPVGETEKKGKDEWTLKVDKEAKEYKGIKKDRYINAYGSVALTVWAPTLKEFKNTIKFAYVVRAEILPKGSSVWLKAEVINPFSRVVCADDPMYDPLEAEPQAQASFGRLYVNAEVLERTPYFGVGSFEIALFPGDIDECIEDNKNGLNEAFNDYQSYTESTAAKDVALGKLDKPSLSGNNEKDRDELHCYKDIVKERYMDIKGQTGLNEDEKKVRSEALKWLKEVYYSADKLHSALNREIYARTTNVVFSFDAGDFFVRDASGKSVHYAAKDGDRLRIQIFRFDVPVSGDVSRIYTIPTLERKAELIFREEGNYINFSPAFFYGAEYFGGNFNLENYNVFQNQPSFGVNIYWNRVGSGGWRDSINRVVPGLSVSMMDYYDKSVILNEGTSEETETEEKNGLEFTVGLCWNPFRDYRDIFNFQVLFYNGDLDNILIGFSIAPNYQKSLFSTDNTETTSFKLGN